MLGPGPGLDRPAEPGRADDRAGSGRHRVRTPWPSEDAAPEPATDDHPFPYLQGRTIPTYFLIALGLILLASLLIVGRPPGGASRTCVRYLDLFFMGAAFLLLETKNVVQFALCSGRHGSSTPWCSSASSSRCCSPSRSRGVSVSREPPFLYGVARDRARVAWLVPPSALLALAGPFAVARGHRVGVPPGLPGEPDLRGAVPRHGAFHRGVRSQPARRDARWGAGVRSAGDRLPQPPVRGGGALRAGLRPATAGRGRSANRRSAAAPATVA